MISQRPQKKATKIQTDQVYMAVRPLTSSFSVEQDFNTMHETPNLVSMMLKKFVYLRLRRNMVQILNTHILIKVKHEFFKTVL